MANKTNANKNFFDSILEVQNQALDTLVENTKKFTNGNAIVEDTIEKGTTMFKNTMNKGVEMTKETIEKVKSANTTAKTTTSQTTDNMTDYFKNLYNQQTTWANQLTEMNKSFLTNMTNPSNFQNPMDMWKNMMNNNQAATTWNNMMNMSSMQDNISKTTEQVKAFWQQVQSVLNTNYSDLAKNFDAKTLADSYKGMFNMTDGFAKFYEMWIPMMKSMQEKTFNMDVFKTNFDLSKYKEFVDSYFTFMPKGSQDYLNNVKNMYTDAFKNTNAQTTEFYNNMKNTFEQMMPNVMGNPFSNMLTSYNQMHTQVMNAVSPFAKLMTPTQDVKTMNEWNEIVNQMNVYNIKSAEMQYMVYEKGMKIMENMASQLMHKIENGEDVDSIMKLYQEWLNMSDAEYVNLFETDTYSALMAEVSALQLRIKKAVETQMEKAFVNVPLATRSEMDEVYQSIYDLKKQVRQLQSMLDLDVNPVSKTTATKTQQRLQQKLLQKKQQENKR
ncbi:MAG: poly(R)-hydroxyalkanoic acid synthase subunit PhaE [Chitinophagaceae bacterium]